MQANSLSSVRQILSIPGATRLAALIGQQLEAGQQIQALTLSYDAARQLAVIRVPGGEIVAQTQLPLVPGQNLLLQVDSVGAQVVLRVIESSAFEIAPNTATPASNLPAGVLPAPAEAAEQIRAALQLLLTGLAQQTPLQLQDSAVNLARLSDLLRYALPLLEEFNPASTPRQLLGSFNQPAEAVLRRLLLGQPASAQDAFRDPAALIRELLGQIAVRPQAPAPPQNLLDTLTQFIRGNPGFPVLRAELERLTAQLIQPAQPGGPGQSAPVAAPALEHATLQLLQLSRSAEQFSRAALGRHIGAIIVELTAQANTPAAGTPGASAPAANVAAAPALPGASSGAATGTAPGSAPPGAASSPASGVAANAAASGTIAADTKSMQPPDALVSSSPAVAELPRAANAQVLLSQLLERAPVLLLLELRAAPPAVRLLLQPLRQALEQLRAQPQAAPQPVLRNLLTALLAAPTAQAAPPLDQQFTQKVISALAELDRPGLALSPDAPDSAVALAEHIARAVSRLVPAELLAPAALERQLGQTLDHLRLALSAPASGVPGGEPLLQQLQFAQQQLSGSLQGSSTAQPVYRALEQALQLLAQLQTGAPQLDPAPEALRLRIAGWLQRFPPDLLRNVPAELNRALPLSRDAFSELQQLSTLFSATLAGPQLLLYNPPFQFQALQSVDVLLTQLFGLRAGAQEAPLPPAAQPALAGQPAPGVAQTVLPQAQLPEAVRNQLLELRERLHTLIRDNSPGAALRPTQHAAARGVLNDLAQLLAQRGTGEAQRMLPAVALRELLDGLDAYRLHNSIALEQGRPLQLLLPILGPGLLALTQIKLLRKSKEEEQRGENSGGGYNLLIALELKHAGPLKFEIHVRQKKLSIRLTTARLTSKKLAAAELESLRQALDERGFELSGFNCIFDPEANAREPEAGHAVSYRKVCFQA